VDLLTVTTAPHADWTVVALRGQLDVATAPGLRERLIETQFGGASRLVLDLGGLEFIDSFGIGVLIGAVRRAASHDGQVVVVCPPGRVRDVLGLAGVSEVLRVGDDLAAAIAAPGATAH
jgi:anti-sigma B factor antagonist